jgi:hypothetical protein
MVETADQIIGDIERGRKWLGTDLDRLEDKVRYEADWRMQYARDRLALLGAALAVGLLLGVAAIWAGRRVFRAKPRLRR